MHINYDTPTAHLKAIDSGSPTNSSPFRKEAVAAPPASMTGAISSPLPPAPPAKEGTRIAKEPKQPRKVLQPGTSDKIERSASDLTTDSESTNASGIPVQNAPSGPASMAKVQMRYGVGSAEQSEFSDDGEQVQAMVSTPETIHYSLESDADSEAVDSGVKQTGHTVTHVTTTTTTRVGEPTKSVDVQKVEQFAAPRPRHDSSAFSSRTTAGQQRYEARSSVQGGVQKKASFYQETRFPTAIESGQSPVVPSSVSKVVETRRFMVPSKSAYGSVREQFVHIERLHREEKDHILALMTGEHEDYKRFCEEQFEAFQMEYETLMQDISTKTSRITLLEIQLQSGGGGGLEIESHPDNVDSNITVITTTITNTITTVTTRIERWKHTGATSKGQVTISSKELEQLSVDLLNTSSRVTELQRYHVELSRNFRTVRHELQVTLSLRDEKDRTIASLTADVAEWKNADALKAQRIVAASQANETFQRDLSAASSRTAELQLRYDAQSNDLSSARNELRTKASLVEERDRTIDSLTAEVARWKQSDVMKAEQISTARQDYEKLLTEFSASSSQTAEFQRRYNAQSKDLGTVRSELQANKSLVEEKERTITKLAAEVEQWKRADATTAAKFAAEHRDKEKLQQALEVFSSQAADLQKRYDAQSTDIISLRNELQTKVSLLEEKERTISSVTTELAQEKGESSMKAEQIVTARGDVEQLRRELASASSRIADLQKRYEAQSKELDTVRDELHQIETLYREGTDQAPVEPSKHAASQRIARALGEKKKQMEELRRDLAASTTRNTELQKSYENLSREISALRDELRVKTSQNEGTITSLTLQVEQWERADTTKAERIAATLTQVEKLQQDLTTSTSQLTELQGRYETQSREFIAVRNELQNSTSSNEGKDRAIASLTAEVDQWKRADGNKAAHIATISKQIEKLQRDSSTSASKLAELQGRYDAQSRELTTVRSELQTKVSLHEGKDHTIASLTAERDQWKHTATTKAEQFATTIKQVEKLERDLSDSASQLAELEGRYEAQSHDLVSVRNELQTRTSSFEDKARTVATLTVQIEEWKRTDALKEERISTLRRQAEDLQRDLNHSSSQITDLQQHYDMQSKELSSLRDQLQAGLSGKDRAVSSLMSQVEEWKCSDAAKAKQLTTARSDLTELQQRYETQSTEFTSQMEGWKRSDATKTEELTIAGNDLEQLRRNLATSSTQIEDWKRSDATKTKELTTAGKDLEQLRRNLATSSTQIEGWKRSDASKTEELTAAHKDLEQLRRDLSGSSSQIIEYQRRCAAQSAQSMELSSQIEQWKHSDADKAEELATARNKLERLQHDLSTSSSRIADIQQRYDTQSTELRSLHEQLQTTLSLAGGKDGTIATLNDQVEEWKRTDAARAEELERADRDRAQLERKLFASSSQIEELQKHHAKEVDALKKSSSSQVSGESKKVYEQITTEVKDYAAVIKLTTTVDQWLRADAKRAEDLAVELARRNKENEELRHHLVTLKDIYTRAPELKQIFQSETIDIQRRYEEQSEVLKSALAERQSQLNGVQRFVATADAYADEMITQMLQKLNAEVQQTTTFMAECMVGDIRPRAAKTTNEQPSAVRRISEAIGQTLVDCLGKKERDDVAPFLPIAFQAYITYYLRSLISSWTVEKGYNNLINKTYEQLQKSEAQMISGRWRSLTRTYITPAWMSDPKPLISVAVAGLSDIVVVAGCAPSISAARSQVSSKFGDKVSSIMSIAGQFGKMIGEVVSADFEVLAIRPLEMFEDSTMEEDVDDYDKGQGMASGTTAGQKVLCSTQLGMTKRMQLESGKSDTLPVIKAKVVLESFLDD